MTVSSRYVPVRTRGTGGRAGRDDDTVEVFPTVGSSEVDRVCDRVLKFPPVIR